MMKARKMKTGLILTVLLLLCCVCFAASADGLPAPVIILDDYDENNPPWFDEYLYVYAEYDGADEIIFEIKDDSREASSTKVKRGTSNSRIAFGEASVRVDPDWYELSNIVYVRTRARIGETYTEWSDYETILFRESLGPATIESITLSKTELTQVDKLIVKVTPVAENICTDVYVDGKFKGYFFGTGECEISINGLDPGKHYVSLDLSCEHYELSSIENAVEFTVLEEGTTEGIVSLNSIEGRNLVNSTVYYQAHLDGADAFICTMLDKHNHVVNSWIITPDSERTESFENGTAVFYLLTQKELYQKSMLDTTTQTIKIKGRVDGKWTEEKTCEVDLIQLGQLDDFSISVAPTQFEIGELITIRVSNVEHAELNAYTIYVASGLQRLLDEDGNTSEDVVIPSVNEYEIGTSAFVYSEPLTPAITMYSAGYKSRHVSLRNTLTMRPRNPEVKQTSSNQFRIDFLDYYDTLYDTYIECEFYVDEQPHEIFNVKEYNPNLYRFRNSYLLLQPENEHAYTEGEHTLHIRYRLAPEEKQEYSGTLAGDWSDWTEFEYTIPAESLTTLVLPADLTVIETGAFTNTSAEKIIIPASVTTIEAKALSDCADLKILYFEGSPASIADDILYGTDNVTIVVPEGSDVENWAKRNGYRIEYH